jgi:hypothetical protein
MRSVNKSGVAGYLAGRASLGQHLSSAGAAREIPQLAGGSGHLRHRRSASRREIDIHRLPASQIRRDSRRVTLCRRKKPSGNCFLFAGRFCLMAARGSIVKSSSLVAFGQLSGRQGDSRCTVSSHVPCRSVLQPRDPGPTGSNHNSFDLGCLLAAWGASPS